MSEMGGSVNEIKSADKLAEPMDAAGIAASAIAMMKLMESRYKGLPLDKWTPEIKRAYKALSEMTKYLLGV